MDTVDNGKPYGDAVGDIEHSVEVLRYYAGWADKMTGRTVPIEGRLTIRRLLQNLRMCSRNKKLK